MKRLSSKHWRSSYACTYEAWNFPYDPNREVHAQDYHELFWVENGEGYHLLNGQKRPMQTGYLVLVREDDRHGFSANNPEETVSFINFAFPTPLWEQVRDGFFQGKNCFFDRKNIEYREFQLNSDERARLRTLGFDLAAGRWNLANAAAFLTGTLALLASHEVGSPQRPLAPEWLARAVRAIESWPHFVGGVAEFVRIAGRSHEHTCRECQRFLSVTPHHLVNRARLKWASMQLETTQKEIIDIAAECGFENLSHFYKQFRTAYTIPPRQYRLKFGIRRQA